MNLTLAEDEIKSLRTCTEKFMNNVYWVQQSFNLIPEKGHHGACINFVDLQERREEFCFELVNTVPEWIYSQKKATRVIDRFVRSGRSLVNANAAFIQHTFDKFRTRDGREIFLQGQFGELLLFNFLQSFFGAVPLLRKMPITTSSKMERFGADAIHYLQRDGKHLFYLGEGKVYTSKYKFSTALQDAITSVLKTYDQHSTELGLYVYDDFIEDPLIDIARSYKEGTLMNVEVHLVSIIVYNETHSIARKSEDQIKADIMAMMSTNGKALERKIFKAIDSALHPRFNYIILPVWELDKLIKTFQTKLGK